MFKIGAHLSASKGYTHMYNEALSIGGNTFQFFTRNPRGGKAKDLDMADIALFNEKSKENFGPILAHAPYTLNACAADDRIREFAYITMEDDLKRLEHTPGAMYNFHPGSHVGQGIDVGIEKISSLLNDILFPEMKTTVLLEAMAGKGSEVGSKFEELKAIIDKTKLNDKLGVCLDTCHIYDAGYDIVNNLDGVNMYFPNDTFYRDQERLNNGYAYEHTLMTSGEKIANGIAYKKYRTELADDYKNKDAFCFVEYGKEIQCTAATELILRSGSAEVVSPFDNQGLSDLTDGVDLKGGAAVPKNHNLLIPRGDDGRGIRITSSNGAYVMVGGAYIIVEP